MFSYSYFLSCSDCFQHSTSFPLLPIWQTFQFIHSFSSLSLLIPQRVYCMSGAVLDTRDLVVTKKIRILLWWCLQSSAALPKRASWSADNVFCRTGNSSWSHVATVLDGEVLVGEIDSKLVNKYTGEFWKMRRGTKIQLNSGMETWWGLMEKPVIGQMERKSVLVGVTCWMEG